MKKIMTITAAILVIGALSVTALAAAYQNPAEIAAGVTGKTAAQVQQERAAGKTYGAIAADAGKLEEFKTGKETLLKEQLAQQVKDGKLTQAKADEILASFKARIADCDGTGNLTGGFGGGKGLGCVNGTCTGAGSGGGRGRGMGNRGGKGFASTAKIA